MTRILVLPFNWFGCVVVLLKSWQLLPTSNIAITGHGHGDHWLDRAVGKTVVSGLRSSINSCIEAGGFRALTVLKCTRWTRRCCANCWTKCSARVGENWPHSFPTIRHRARRADWVGPDSPTAGLALGRSAISGNGAARPAGVE